jgi:hypothetical protein
MTKSDRTSLLASDPSKRQNKQTPGAMPMKTIKDRLPRSWTITARVIEAAYVEGYATVARHIEEYGRSARYKKPKVKKARPPVLPIAA